MTKPKAQPPHECRCQHCGKTFRAASPRAAYCCAAHKTAAGRARARLRQAEAQPEPASPAEVDDEGRERIPAAGSLYGATMAKLIELGKESDYDGQIALEYARQIGIGASGAGGMLDKLLALMRTLDPAAPSPGKGPDPEPEPDDELGRMRLERDRIAAAAAGPS